MDESLSVLIVDDSRIMRRMVARSLALSGVTLRDVHEASDGQQALSLMRGTRIDVVFADINMPIMNGVEMVEKMAADRTFAAPPVIIVSSERNDKRIARLKELGVHAYINKPFMPEQFVVALRAVLGKRGAS